MMTAEKPKKLGRYEVLDELGRGAMGVVYLARDPVIHRLVALKTFRTGPEVEEREQKVFRERFLLEARSCGRLNHPNIVTIHDVVEVSDDEVAFMAMEYVRGTNLKQVLRKGELKDLPAVANIIRQVGSALDYAHAQGVVHRDVKPANILLTEKNEAKLTDFGIARLNTSNLTHDGQLIGTPNYMSPEQIRGVPVDHRADIFSFGVVLYEMLTRQKPFRADNLTAVTYRIVNEPFEPVNSVLGVLPPGVSTVLEKALAKDPGDRFASAGEVVAALDGVLSSPVGISVVASELLEEEGTGLHEVDIDAAFDALVPPPVEVPPAPEEPSPAEPPVSGESAEAVELSPPPTLPEPEYELPDGGLLPSIDELEEPVPATAAEKKGPWGEVLDQTRSFLDRTIPPEARPSRKRVLIYAGAGVLLFLLGVLAVQGVRHGLRVGQAEMEAQNRLEWSNDFSELMVSGARRLDSGDVQFALGAFQRAQILLDERNGEIEALRRQAREDGDQERSKALEEEASDLREREEALRLALLSSEWRREELYAQAVAAQGVQEALVAARSAVNDKDEAAARAWALEALALDPSQGEAQEIVQGIESRRARGAQGRPERPVAVRARRPPPSPRQEAPTEAASPAAVAPATARLILDFVSDLPKGVLLLYVDEEQVLRENFRFMERGGLFRRQKAKTGRLEKSFTLDAGPHTLRVYVSGARNRPTEVRTFELELGAGVSQRLSVKVDAEGRVEAGLAG